MKFKFNWGTGILITIILFMVIMISIIVFSMNQQVNLVSPDYYPKGVNHEEHLQKIRNTNQLKATIAYKNIKDSLILSFPDEHRGKNVSGTAHFYYMADFEKDMKFEIMLDSNLQHVFLLDQIKKGRYIIKLDWSDGEKEYYHEIDINL